MGAREDRTEAFLGERECAFVVGPDGLVEQAAVAGAHHGAAVLEERHQCLQADAGVDELGRICVSAVITGENAKTRLAGRQLGLAAERVFGEALAVVG